MTRTAPYIRCAVAAISTLVLQACANERAPTGLLRDGMLPAANEAPSDPADRRLVVFAAERVPADFGERVRQAGGSVEAAIDGIGVAAVSGLTEAAAAQLAAEHDVRAVEPDARKSALDDDTGSGENSVEEPAPADATFYGRQWNMRAVFADAAWAAGHRGSSNVRVAILDTGIDYLHPDLRGLVDLEHSRSFAAADSDDPAITELFKQRFPNRSGPIAISDLRGHGTAMASIVGSNATFLAGVNRHVTLLAVKIWNRRGQGPLSQLLGGIVYAADQGADVINVSGSYDIDKSRSPGTIAAVQRAVNYAFRKGALLISVAGNDAADLDHNEDMVRLPCQAANALCASATGPTSAGSVDGPWTDVDAPAPYSAFGRSAIHIAAPGGIGAQFRRIWILCTTTGTLEFVFAPPCAPRGQPLPAAVAACGGSSCSAAHVTGLAALLVAQIGKGKPALIRSRILQSADDLGEVGVDPYYGKGRMNVARALGLLE